MFARFETPDTPTVHRGPPFANEQPESKATLERGACGFPGVRAHILPSAPIAHTRRTDDDDSILVVPLSRSYHSTSVVGAVRLWDTARRRAGGGGAHRGRCSNSPSRRCGGGDDVGRYHLAGVSHELGTTSGRYCAMCVMNEEQSRVVSHPTNARRVSEESSPARGIHNTWWSVGHWIFSANLVAARRPGRDPRRVSRHTGRARSRRPHPLAMDKDGKTLIKAKPRPGVAGINRVLVTGGAGFVGSHLIDYLMERGDHVMCLDNFFTGSKEDIGTTSASQTSRSSATTSSEPHPAGVRSGVPPRLPRLSVHYKFNPVKTIKTNVIGTLNMLGLAKQVKARFLLTSTSEVYGDPLSTPPDRGVLGQRQSHRRRSCYDEGKRYMETLAFDYKREHGLEVRVAPHLQHPPPGPRSRRIDGHGRVVSNFVKQAIEGTPMTIYGDGSQTRSFQYVSDLVKGLVALMDGDTGPSLIGNPGEFTMLELAEKVKEVVNQTRPRSSRRTRAMIRVDVGRTSPRRRNFSGGSRSCRSPTASSSWSDFEAAPRRGGWSAAKKAKN